MVRMVGNFDIAEEVVQDSLLAALETWPLQGIPEKPGAWLMTTARRRAIDVLRRDQRYADKVALLERSTMPVEPVEADDRPAIGDEPFHGGESDPGGGPGDEDGGVVFSHAGCSLVKYSSRSARL